MSLGLILHSFIICSLKLIKVSGHLPQPPPPICVHSDLLGTDLDQINSYLILHILIQFNDIKLVLIINVTIRFQMLVETSPFILR